MTWHYEKSKIMLLATGCVSELRIADEAVTGRKCDLEKGEWGLKRRD